MSVPGDQGLITQLKDMPKYIVGESSRTIIGELIEEPKQPVVDTEQVRCNDSVHRSCLSELWQDRPQGVAELCHFAVRRKAIEPTYLRLGRGRYVVSNLTDIHTSCNGEPHAPPTGSACALCLVTLSCGCSLSTNKAVLTAARSDCDCSMSTIVFLLSIEGINHTVERHAEVYSRRKFAYHNWRSNRRTESTAVLLRLGEYFTDRKQVK
jgi:hypothetical protein